MHEYYYKKKNKYIIITIFLIILLYFKYFFTNIFNTCLYKVNKFHCNVFHNMLNINNMMINYTKNITHNITHMENNFALLYLHETNHLRKHNSHHHYLSIFLF